MLFENVYDVSIVDKNVDFGLLKDYCDDWGLSWEDSPSGHWFAFGFYYGLTHYLDPTSSKCMGDILSYYFTGVKLDNSSKFYRLDNIIDDLDEIIYEAYDFDDSDDKIALKLLVDVYELFDEVYDKYAYNTEQVLLRISLPLKNKFKNVRGDSYSEKLFNLISLYESSNHF